MFFTLDTQLSVAAYPERFVLPVAWVPLKLMKGLKSLPWKEWVAAIPGQLEHRTFTTVMGGKALRRNVGQYPNLRGEKLIGHFA